jgi:2-methylcitrate synthase/citrate synthase II
VQREGQEFIRVPKGLANVIVDQTYISGVDPKGQNTIYRGYLITDIGRHASFEEAAYLILYGKLPCDEELKEFTRKLNSERWIPTKLIDALKMAPPAHPMYYGSFGIILLGMYDPNPDDMSPEALYDRAIRIIAKLPVIFANGWYLSRYGYAVEPDRSLPHAQDVLRMLLGGRKVPGSLESRVFESSLILYMDHGFNASTFTNRVIASTLSDMYSAVAGAIGALKGPLHGGANQRALEMMLEIGEPEKVREYVVKKLKRHEKIMGFGHRVYKIHDPRTDVLREWLVKLADYHPEARKFLQMINELEKVMWELKRIPSNVDLYTGAIYHVLGIPKELFTPIFAIARVVGWTAHYIEQVTNNKIIRPKEEYVGPTGLKYVPIEERCKR